VKQSVFRFDLLLQTLEGDATLESIKGNLEGISGVDKVEGELSQSVLVLRVAVSFPEAEAAWELHRRITHRLMKTEGVTITDATAVVRNPRSRRSGTPVPGNVNSGTDRSRRPGSA